MDSHSMTSAIKLEGQKNWSAWKFQVTVMLKGAELFSVVNGTEIKPEGDAPAWTRKDAKAQTIIVSRLTEEVVAHVLTCETAKAMWKKLRSIFESTSATGTLMLQQRFLQCKYEGGDLSVFLSKLQEMVCQLKHAGEEVSDKFLITKVLMSLPERYSHFISAWESVDSAKQNYDDLVARLLVEEGRLKAREDDNKENMALYTHHKNQKSGGVVKKCFKCGKPGHFAQKCKSETDNRKCFTCGKTGHLKSECYKNTKERSNYGSSSKQSNAITVTTAAMVSGSGSVNDDNRQSTKWLIDSGASEHMTGERSMFIRYSKISNRTVVVGDGRRVPVIGIGEVKLQIFNDSEYIESILHNVLHVPALKMNLFSVPSATRKGYKVTMSNKRCLIYKDNILCAVGNQIGNAYILDVMYEDEAHVAVVTLSERHERLCHQSLDHVKRTLKKNNIQFEQSEAQCTACLKGKIHRLPFTESSREATVPLELIHGDICGPFEVQSIGGSKYFLLLKDDYTNYRVVYFLKRKDEVASRIKQFINWPERQTGHKVKMLRTDNGKEFVNSDIQEMLQEKGIQHQTTVPYTPQQNGKAEREMRTLVEAARSMINTKKLSKELWAEAINTVTYVSNRTGKSRVKEKTPYQIWTGEDYDVTNLNKIFGTKVWVHIPKEKRRKLDSKAEEGMFVGYDSTKGFRIYYEKEKTVLTKRDIVFKTNDDPAKTNTRKEEESRETIVYLDMSDTDNEREDIREEEDSQEGEEEGEEDAEQHEEQQEILGNGNEANDQDDDEFSDATEQPIITRSGRSVNKPRHLQDYDTMFLALGEEPKSYKEAMECEDAESWKKSNKCGAEATKRK